jgi:predicted ATPase/class 3 adenylate cyclase
MEALESYLAIDRRLALAGRLALPLSSCGCALFADVSGFTPLTEALARTLGARRGAEELSIHLNSVYQPLIEQVHSHGGSVIAFAGDAITCWFDSDDGRRATACALAMQQEMQQFSKLDLANGETVSLAVKIGLAQGPVRRFVVGNPEIQVLDVLAGRTLSRMAAAAHQATRGEVLLDAETAGKLGHALTVAGWKQGGEHEPAFAIARACAVSTAQPSWPELPELAESTIRPWLLRPVYERLRAGQGEFLTELRPAVAQFIKFEGIDYDRDEEAGQKLSSFVSWLQDVLGRYEGFMVDVAIGDKGSYLYSCFGAPIAHENDVWRALTVAGEIIRAPRKLDFISAIQVGISRGTMRTGAYGGSTRRTYGVLGDEVNLAARLMEHASDGQVLVSESVHRAAGTAFAWQSFPAIKAKGKSQPVPVFALLGPAGRAAPRLLDQQFTLPLVGRARELELLVRKMEQVATGRGQVVAVSAEAGIGKSRLVAEAMRLTRAQGLRGYAGECQSHGTNIRYLPWQTIWEGLFDLDTEAAAAEQVGALDSRLAEVNPLLTARLPLLGAILNLPIPDNELTGPLEARLRKLSLETLLVECLRSISEDNPLFIVLEDTHWMDALSHDLLDALARSIAQSPVLLVLTQRPPEPGHPQLQSIRQLPYFDEILLNAFTEDEAARLITLKLARLFSLEGPAPPALVGRLVARSAGNPFYLEELLNFLKDQKIDFLDPQAVASLELPASLHSLVLSRIDRLTENEQACLKVASVIGRVFPAAAVWGVQNHIDPQIVSADLKRLREADLTALERPEPELVYIFKHVVTQEVTYESLAHATRSRLHNEIGLLLERLYADKLAQNVDLLAFHFDRSLNADKKREYLCKAGEAAQAQYANQAAISYFERALPLLSVADSIPVLLKLGKVWELTGEWKKAGACYQRAFEAAGSRQDRHAQARCQAATGDLLRKQGLYPEATDWLGLARTCFEELRDTAGVGQTLHAAGTVAAMQGDYAKAQTLYEESLTLRRQLGDKPQIASLCSNLGIIARFHRNRKLARELCEQGLELRREVGDRWAIANSLNNLGVLLRDTGELVRARALLEEALTLNRQVGDRWAIANTLSSLAEAALDQKDWSATQAFLRESLTINLELGDRIAVAFVLECFAAIAAAHAEARLALRLVNAASALRQSLGSPLSPAEQTRLDRYMEPARRALPAEEAAAVTRQGLAMSLDEAVALTQAASFGS